MCDLNFLFLGTSAFDYSKKLETDYKDTFDYDARRAAMGLLNERYLIDCGLHCEDSIRIAGIDSSKISDIFITHLHKDHYCVDAIQNIAKNRETPLNVWVRWDAEVPEIFNVRWVKMDKLREYVLPDGMMVKSLQANHDENVYPQHFLFEKNGKRFLYACDGAWFLTETYYALKESRLSLLVLDGTCGDYEGEWRMAEHNSIPMIRLMLPSLKAWGMVDECSEIYISHIAPSLHKPHFETVEIMKEMGVKVAFDGLKIGI